MGSLLKRNLSIFHFINILSKIVYGNIHPKHSPGLLVSCLKVFYKTVVIKILQNFHENTCGSFFCNIVASWNTTTILKRDYSTCLFL